MQHIHEVILDYRLTNLLSCLKQYEENGNQILNIDKETFISYVDRCAVMW